MDDDKHRHPNTDPLMCLLTGHLISHETEQENGHTDIDDPFFHTSVHAGRSPALLAVGRAVPAQTMMNAFI
jgi:hypothetical protein